MTVEALSLIVTNIRLETGNSARPWATALGIASGRLAITGAAAEILKMPRTECRIIDGGGQHILLPPGMTVGSVATVTVADDGTVSLRGERDES